jgi:gliding motility-associated-like protein
MKQLILIPFVLCILSISTLTAQVNLGVGLVAHWNFNGNANDVSGNGNNGIVFGATLVPGKAGIPNTAYYFNGTSDYIQVANSTSINSFPNDSFTIYALIKTQGFYAGLCHGNSIVDKGNSDYINGWYTLRCSDAYSTAFLNCSTPMNPTLQNYSLECFNQLPIPGSYMPYVDTSQWDCVIATYDGDSSKLFVNGVLKQTMGLSGPLGSNTNDLFIGRKNSAAYPYWVHGIMDEIRIYNRVINTQEIDSLCNINNLNSTITANFSTSIPNNCDSSIIQFTDLSTATNSTITSWNWYFGDGNSSVLQNPIHNYSGSGTFLVSLIVTSSTNQKDTFYQSITSNENSINVIANVSNSIVCIGKPVIFSGSGANTYVWTGGVSNGLSFVPTTTSTYTVTGTDANGCTATSSITVTVVQNLAINVTPSNPLLCLGDSVQLTASGATIFIWTNAAGLSATSGTSVWAYPTASTTYTITGSDANGCSGSTSVAITVLENINVEVSKNRDAECNVKTVQLQASGALNYQWSPAGLVSNPNAALTNAIVNQTTTFYVLGISGTCTDLDSIVVYNYNSDESGIFIPTAFSPNGDGVNDCLQVINSTKFTSYYFGIYNRWGELVFEADNANDCWNGEYKNQAAAIDTYYYFLKAETSCGPILKKGDIVLIR